ncbi:hypothetical protein EI613_08675 [Azospirillum sp. 412522]|nr:hypothetical protein [Azospirillum sp. 412522]MBY6261995.1 hypothetical protein [Azospirillum sp. 412522]
MTVTGYGRTYAEALADAESKLQSERDAETVGQIGGGIFGLLVAAILSTGWLLANAALRPIAGAAYLVLAGAMIWLVNAVADLILGGVETGLIGLLLLVMVKIALLGLFIGLAFQSRSAMLSLELVEARLLHGCFAASPAIGMILHILLYGLTAVGGYLFAAVLLRRGASLILERQAFLQSFGIEDTLMMVINGPAPPWAVVAAIIAAVVALVRRRYFHPFARHFTLLGRLRPA